MIHYTAIKADLKMIVREPIMILFLLTPIFMFLLVKGLLVFGQPMLYEQAGIDISQYGGYILAFVFLMPATTLGAVSGFLMIDDRDAHIFALMSVMPIGVKGYIGMRLCIPLIGGSFYTIIGYILMNIQPMPIGILLYISLLVGICGVFIGILLFILAKDKVQGLTYAKGMGVLNILALADLLEIGWLRMIAGATPFYWVVRMVQTPDRLTMVMAAVVYLFWMTIMWRLVDKSVAITR